MRQIRPLRKHFTFPLFLPALLAALGLVPADCATAQTFKTLYCFTNLPNETQTNADGANPQAGLVLSGNTLYGTAEYGGSLGGGTLFALSTAGTSFTVLHNFVWHYPYNGDGSLPYAGLVLASNTLYGAALGGGNFGSGTLFSINTDFTGFTNFYSFSSDNSPGIQTNLDGAYPKGELTLSGNTLYGTASKGGIPPFNPNGIGSSDQGTVFALNTGGSDFVTVHTFDWLSGSTPVAGMVLSSNTLYGTTGGVVNGIGPDYGTIFRVNTDGTGFTNLYVFFSGDTGANPYGGLILSSNTLYGTAKTGAGATENGTIFRINTDGTGFTNIYNFNGLDGSYPMGTLLLSGNALYGTTFTGINTFWGSVFKVNTDGTGFTNLHIFNAWDGANPSSGLILSNYVLYGTTAYGGIAGVGGVGTIFSISFAPQLTMTLSGSNVILSWPTNVAGFDYTGFTLQSATDPASTTWTNVSPSPVIANGFNTVTNPIPGTRMFYRLKQ